MYQPTYKDKAEYFYWTVDKYHQIKDGNCNDDDSSYCDKNYVCDDDAVDDMKVMTVVRKVTELFIL